MVTKTIIWHTKDGRSIPVGDLTEPHLQNIICFLIKRLDKLEAEIEVFWSAYSSLEGKMPMYYLEGQISFLEQRQNKILRWLQIMRVEQVYRTKREQD